MSPVSVHYENAIMSLTVVVVFVNCWEKQTEDKICLFTEESKWGSGSEVRHLLICMCVFVYLLHTLQAYADEEVQCLFLASLWSSQLNFTNF